MIELAATGSILVYDPRYSHDYRFPPEKADRSTEDSVACSIKDLYERFEIKFDSLERLKFKKFRTLPGRLTRGAGVGRVSG